MVRPLRVKILPSPYSILNENKPLSRSHIPPKRRYTVTRDRALGCHLTRLRHAMRGRCLIGAAIFHQIRNVYRIYLNSKHSPSTPAMDRLPPEILLRIFNYLQPKLAQLPQGNCE